MRQILLHVANPKCEFRRIVCWLLKYLQKSERFTSKRTNSAVTYWHLRQNSEARSDEAVSEANVTNSAVMLWYTRQSVTNSAVMLWHTRQSVTNSAVTRLHLCQSVTNVTNVTHFRVRVSTFRKNILSSLSFLKILFLYFVILKILRTLAGGIVWKGKYSAKNTKIFSN